jgi:hypothetical protein
MPAIPVSPDVPLDFLREASPRSLQDLELAAQNRGANLSKAIRAELEAWVEQVATAMLARWFIENRDRLETAGAAPKKADFLELQKRERSA